MTTLMRSPHLRVVRDGDLPSAVVYHTLFGNPRIFNDEGMEFLDLFRQPQSMCDVVAACDDDPGDLIKDLRDLRYLVEPDEDERSIIRVLREAHLSKLHAGETVDRMGLAISDSCNFACAHCIHFQKESNGGTALPLYGQPRALLNMTWNTARRCIDHYVALMRKQGSRRGKIHFGNAEPLVNWSVVARILNYFAGFADISFEFAVNTNLVLMTHEIAETFKRYQVRIATSLDGTEQANDAIRVTKGGRGTFRNIVEKFDLLESIGYPLDGFSITVADKNFNLVDQSIVTFAASRKMTSLALDYDLVSLVNIPIHTRVEKLLQLKRMANAVGIDFFGTWDSAFRNLTSVSLLSGTHGFCAAVEGRSLEFNVDGSIKVCGHTTTRVGHVDQFNDLFAESSQFNELVAARYPGLDSYCTGCNIEGPCGGQCHVTREVAGRSGNTIGRRLMEDMCEFYSKITEALLVDYLRSDGAHIDRERTSC